jgi:hypothetical protein
MLKKCTGIVKYVTYQDGGDSKLACIEIVTSVKLQNKLSKNA